MVASDVNIPAINDERFRRRVSKARACANGVRNVRIVESARGSRFYLCRLSATDPALSAGIRRLPVLRCSGFTPVDQDAGLC